MECHSGDVDNIEGLQGNNCQLKKWITSGREPQTSVEL